MAAADEAVLVKPTKQFVLKMAYLADSEVGGSERATVARTSAGRMQRESPFWQSLLLSTPC